MTVYRASSPCRRLFGGLVGGLLAILIDYGSMATSAYAAVTLLADEPLRLGMLASQEVTNGSCPGLAIESVNVSNSGKYVYRVRFAANWQGSLTKVEIDPKTGSDVTELWRAGDQLSARLVIVPGVKDTPWLTERRIATRDSTGKAVPFLWDSLTLTQQDSLAPGKAARGQAILEFLRGSRANEGSTVDQFRIRAGPLGDISNSRAVFVGAPNAPYLDRNDPGYSTFRNAYAGRSGRVYVGANDGMIHAFDDATGDETWAYVPLALYRSDSTGLGALSYQDGAFPPFQHHYYVDSTPRITDVDFGTGAWRSLLVSGLGKGGRAYFAIDVTNPSDLKTEADFVNHVVWDFSDPEIGYSYGQPIISKTHGFPGKWVAILPSGYNNANGDGKLFFVDAATGTLLKTMSTGAGDGATPSGLGHIAGYTTDYRNQMTEQVYGGDLLGNFWRFDISDPDKNAWKVEKIARLTDIGGAGQPVTIAPRIGIDAQNGVDRWVFVGTGKLYHASDIANTQTQSLYAIRDGTATAPRPIAKTLTRSDLMEVADADGLGTKPDYGWYDDLPAGQRIILPMQAVLSVVAYVATSPQDDPCLTGQPATIYARQFSRGNSLVRNESGRIAESAYLAGGGVALELLGLDNATREISNAAPSIVLGVPLGTTGKIESLRIKGAAFPVAHRMAWRLLAE